MNKLLLSLSLLLPVCSLAREFTDTKGRKLEAEIMAVDGASVTLKRAADGQVFTVPTTTFSAADQEVITAFAAANVSYKFEVKPGKERLSKIKRKVGNVEVEDESWAYKVELRNLSRTAADGMRVEYWLFKRPDEGGKTKLAPRLASKGKHTIATLPKGGSISFTTDPVVLSKTQLDADRYYLDGAKNKTADSLGGMVLRVFSGDRRVYEYATDADLSAAAVDSPGATTAPASN